MVSCELIPKKHQLVWIRNTVRKIPPIKGIIFVFLKLVKPEKVVCRASVYVYVVNLKGAVKVTSLTYLKMAESR